MTYRVYSGPHGTEMFSPMDKDRMLFKQFPSIDDALAWASHASKEGRVVLLIEGDDGMRLDREAVAAALHHTQAA
jgi:hypothetical protein